MADPASFAPYGDARPLVRLALDGSHTLGFALQGAAHTAGAVKDNSVTYAGVRAAADLSFTAGAGLIKERLTLRSAAAPSTWVFPLTLSGVRAAAEPGGGIGFATATGKVLAVVPHGFMTDSAVNPRSGDGARSDGVTYAVTTVAGQPAIEMTLDTAWLDAKNRVFPVTVDPSVSATNSNGTTYVMSSAAGDNSGGPEIKVGTWDGGTDVAKSFLKFDSVSSSLQNENVLGAVLGVFNSWSYSCSPRPVQVYPVTSSWPVTGSKSWPGPSTGAAIARMNFATGWVPLGSTTSPCPASWKGFDLRQAGTNLINGWTHGTIANNGLALGASGSDSYGWKKFTSINNPPGQPFLSITYTPYGATYKLASAKPVTQIWPNQNGVLAIKVTNTGAATWTPTNGFELSYVAFNAAGHQVASHPVFTPMPSTVAPGQTVTVNAKVNALPVGTYAINFDMYANATTSSPVSFKSQGVQPFAVGLDIPQPPPFVTGVYPPTGYISPTAQPQLSTTAFSTTGTSISYDFSLTCNPLPGETCPPSIIDSGKITTPYWTPATALNWNTPYSWTVTATTNGASTTVGPVTITPEVPQPAVTSRLGGASGQPFDPQTGDYTTSATDAAVAVAGPKLQIDRSYNSQDPRTTGAFGAGWSSVVDSSVTADGDGSGNVVVTMPDGSQERFGQASATGTYAPPMGSQDALTHNSDGTWSLMVGGGTGFGFTTTGNLSKITDPGGLVQTFILNGSAEATTITDGASGRALHLTWSTPPGAAHPHVATVTTDPPASGQAALTWTYSYSGDELTQVCAPTGGCTSYGYGSTGSQYQSAVLGGNPRSYWQFGDASGSAAVADEVGANLGTTDGTYANVTLGAAGPLAGGSATAGSFNGTSSAVTLPDDLISDSTNVAVELWFKAASASASGVLFGYQADALSNSGGNSAHHVPALYVGGDGKLYGELWNGKIDPMVSPAGVADGNWHHVVLTGSATAQTLWLDGTQIGSLSGQIDQQNNVKDTAGAGFWQGGWPNAYANLGGSIVNTAIGYFAGSIGQVAVYPHALGQPAIAAHTTLGRTAAAELTQVMLPSGRVDEQVGYDTSNGRVATYTDPAGGQWQIHQPLDTGYKATSETLGEVTSNVTVADPAGRDEVYGYDALKGGRLVSYNRGAGDPPRTFTYDAAGFLSSVTDEDSNLVSFTNDIHGNVLSRTWSPTQPGSSGAARAAGSGSSRSSGPAIGPHAAAAAAATAAAGSFCTATGAACTSYYSYYFNGNNPLDPQNDELATARDARSSSATDTTYQTSYTHNATGELTGTTTPATSDFPSGRTTTDTYSTGSEAAYGGGTVPAGLLLTQKTPGGAATSYSYYRTGDLAQVTEPSGRRTVYAYDGLGRPATATTYTDAFPSGLVTSYGYTPLGQPATVSYPAVHDQVTGAVHTPRDSYTYDSDANLAQLTESDLSGSDTPRVTSYTYNDHGQVATVTGPAGATSGSNPPPQGAGSPYPAGATTAYTYAGTGNVASRTDADGNTYDYSYNEYNEVTQVTLHTTSTSQASTSQPCTPNEVQAPDGGCDLVLQSGTYDPAGRLAATTDAMGRITNYSYDAVGDLTLMQRNSATGATGQITAYTYDPAGNQTSDTAAGLASGAVSGPSTVTDDTFDAASRLVSQVTDPVPAGTSGGGYASRTASFTYNADDHVTARAVTGANGSSTTNSTYNTIGELASQTVAAGSAAAATTTWTYNQLGLPAAVVSPDGNTSGATAANYTTSYSYDEAGNVAVVTGPPVTTQVYGGSATTARPVTRYGYDTFGDRAEAENPNQNTTVTAYDGGGRVTSVSQPSYTPPGSTTALGGTTSYGYDGLGNLVKVTDPAGNATTYTYDALRDVTSKTDPQLSGQSAPGVWTYGYDSDGEQLSATDPLQKTVAQATYDDFGDQATTTDALSHTTSYTHDYLGDVTQVTSPAGVVTKNTYDHLGELTASADAYGNATSYAYDYAGRVHQVINPDQTSTIFGYDPAGNVTGITDNGYVAPPQTPPVLRTEAFGYDPAGNLTSATDGNTHTTTYGYDAANELTSQKRPVSASATITTGYTYDPAGSQTSVTDGNTNATWTTYNSRNLPESVIEPATASATAASQRTWTTAYDADGRPATVTQPGGVTQSYSYDQLGDLTRQSGTGAAAATPTQSFGYDLDGRMTSASAPGGTDTFGYNAAGNLTASSGPSGTASFTYNPDGALASRTDAAGTSSYTYDQAGRPSTAADPVTGATLTYGYTSNSQVASIAYAAGGTPGPKQSFLYDQLGQVTSQALTAVSGATIASAAYNHDNAGNLTSQTTAGYAGAASIAYTYDQANRLMSAASGGTTTGYGYDAAGNLTQAGGTSYGYNAQDQLTSSTSASGATSYSYTLAGALTSVTPPGGPARTFTSNAYGQTMSAPGVSYGYDALGRLVTRGTGSGTASLAYSGSGTTLASDGSSSYSTGPSGDPIGVKTASGATGAAVTSPVHGDITGLVGTASGTTGLAASAAYGPYGAVTATSGAMPALGYQGDYTDPATGQVDMSARWYSPSTAGFTSNDTVAGAPMPDPSGSVPAPYGYAGGNPLTTMDPTGHCSGFWNCVGAGWNAYVNGLGCVVTYVLGGCNSVAPSVRSPGPPPCHIACGGPPVLPAPPGYGSGGGSGGNGGGGGRGCGWSCGIIGVIGVGIGGGGGGAGPAVCAVLCFVPLPPPPPPPPQDCYALATPCQPRPAPRWLRHSEYDSRQPRTVTNPRAIPNNDTVVSPAETEQQYLDQLKSEIAGARASAGENGFGTGSGDDGLANTSPSNINQPATPEASSPEAGTGGSGGSAGNPPTTPPGAAEPPAEGGGTGGGGNVPPTPGQAGPPSSGGANGVARFEVGSNGTITKILDPSAVYAPGESVPGLTTSYSPDELTGVVRPYGYDSPAPVQTDPVTGTRIYSPGQLSADQPTAPPDRLYFEQTPEEMPTTPAQKFLYVFKKFLDLIHYFGHDVGGK